MKSKHLIKEEMNRLGWSNVNHSINFDDIEFFKNDILSRKRQEIEKYGEGYLRDNNYLDITKCQFQFREPYIRLIESEWLNEIVDTLLNESAIMYDFFGLLNIDQDNQNHHRNQFHRDQAFLGGLRASILVIIPLIDFTEEVGPTEIVSGTHLFKEKPSEEFIANHFAKLIAKKGEVIVVDASLWHRGGKNLTSSTRPAIIIRYQLPFLKRPFDLAEVYKEEMQNASPLLRKRLGFACREMNSFEEMFDLEVKFQKGQYNIDNLYYNG